MKKMLFGKRMWIILVITLLLFGGVIAMQWYGRIMMNEAMNNMPMPPAVVSTSEATSAPWQKSVEPVGTLTAIHGAQLATEAQGTIEAIHFDNGAEIKAGDVIMSLSSAPDRAELKALQAAGKLAELDLERAQSLVAKRNISKAELDELASAVDQAKARIQAQQARLDQKALRAPYDGRLGIRRHNVGDYVQAGDTFIELQALDKLYADFSLPEQYSREVHAGMSVSVIVPALASQSFEGVITAISPVVDTDTRNFALQATVANQDHLLRPGMSVRVQVHIGEESNQVVVPQTAISYSSYGNSVFVIEDQGDGLVATQRFVTAGPARGDMVAILEGLQEGEVVATSGLLKLYSGSPVIVNNAIQPDSSLQPEPENG